MELYGIAEPPGLFQPMHFAGTRATPPEIRGSLVEHIFDRHQELGVRNIIWQLGRSFMAFHTDHPLLTPMGGITFEDGLEGEITSEKDRQWLAYFRGECPLRRALDTAAERGLPLWGWLCMNRNYGLGSGSVRASRYLQEHREATIEWHKNGKQARGKHCYFLPEFRIERMAAILEAARITGPQSGKRLDAIVLDFCRQPPMLLYHPTMCQAYRLNDAWPVRPGPDAPEFIAAGELGNWGGTRHRGAGEYAVYLLATDGALVQTLSEYDRGQDEQGGPAPSTQAMGFDLDADGRDELYVFTGDGTWTCYRSED